MRPIALFLVLLLTFFSGNAQRKKNEKSFDAKVRVILNTNDTLYGTANIKKAHVWNHFKKTTLSEILIFKEESTGKEKTYRPDDVKGFIITTYDGKDAVFYSSKIFVHLKIPKESILDDRDGFLHLIYEGSMSVYRYYFNASSFHNNHFVTTYREIEYLVNENNQVFSAPLFTSWKNRLKEFLGDCPSLIEKIEKGIYNEWHLIQIAEEYNSTCGT